MIPDAILIMSKIEMIFSVSLKSLFFNRTNKPKPAFDNKPLITAPNDIVPFISIIVKPIDTAQLGIKPTKAAIIGCKNLLPLIRESTSMFARK